MRLFPEFLEVSSHNGRGHYNATTTKSSHVIVSCDPGIDENSIWDKAFLTAGPMPDVMPGLRSGTRDKLKDRLANDSWRKLTTPNPVVRFVAFSAGVAYPNVVTVKSVRTNSPKNTKILVQFQFEMSSSTFTEPFYLQLQIVGEQLSAAIGPFYVTTRPLTKRARISFADTLPPSIEPAASIIPVPETPLPPPREIENFSINSIEVETPPKETARLEQQIERLVSEIQSLRDNLFSDIQNLRREVGRAVDGKDRQSQPPSVAASRWRGSSIIGMEGNRDYCEFMEGAF